MPREAKSSPEFQEVSPATVPPHSFCHICFPIRLASEGERFIAARAKSAGIKKQKAVRTTLFRHFRPMTLLDDRTLCISMAVPEAPNVTISTASGVIFLMKRLTICLGAIFLTSIGLAQDKQQPQLKDQKEKASYSIGHELGSSLKKGNMDVNVDILTKGLRDGLSGAKSALTDEQIKETMTAFQKEMMEKQKQAEKEKGEKNAAEGEKFLAENKKKDGVKTTASGLQYKVQKEGSGESPKETDTVVVNYRGTLLDGTEFDSSFKRNEPATFPVNRVIKGWTEALLMMKPGAKYQLWFPSALEYGDRGVGKDIGPNSTLVFDVELLSIKPPETPGANTTPGAAPAGAGNKASTPAAAAPPAPKGATAAAKPGGPPA